MVLHKDLVRSYQRQDRVYIYLLTLAGLFFLSITAGALLARWSISRQIAGFSEGPVLSAGDYVQSSFGSGGPLEPLSVEYLENSLSVDAIPADLEPPDLERFTYTISKDDNLYTALQCFGVPGGVILSWCDLCKGKYNLASLKPGQTFCLYSNGDKEFVRFELNISRVERLVIEKIGEGYQAVREMIELGSDESGEEEDRYFASPCWVDPVTGFYYYRGEVSTNFYAAAVRAGMTPNKIMSLIRVFGGLSFDRDLKEGDRFSVVVAPGDIPGEEGPILAAMIESWGKPHYVFRLEEGDNFGYYDEKGKASKNSTLVCPVKYQRISSYFSYRRYHPVLHKYRPHLGVDYAARNGTPVRAAASGKIVFIGWKGEYGRAIAIRHNGEFTTHYAHLARYAPGMKKGKYVRQGQTIGYVGSSGMASGPHLDYRVFRNGRAVNPLRVTGMPGPPVKDKKAFEQTRDMMMDELVAELPMGPPMPWPLSKADTELAQAGRETDQP